MTLMIEKNLKLFFLKWVLDAVFTQCVAEVLCTATKEEPASPHVTEPTSQITFQLSEPILT